MVEPYYQEDGITIYHGDCRDVLPVSPGCFVTDPPYGLAERWTGGTWFRKGAYAADNCQWDSAAPIDLVARLVESAPSIIWGGNYFALPPSRCWLVWHKTNAPKTMADVELAWTSFDRPAKAFSAPCGVKRGRCHPTEKPLDLMIWCLSFLQVEPVVDPFMGSGTTLSAAKELGRRAIGIEIDERYCEMAAERLRQSVLDFDPPAPDPEQVDLLAQ